MIKSPRHPEYRATLAAAFLLRDRLTAGGGRRDHDEAVELATATGLQPTTHVIFGPHRSLAQELSLLIPQLAKADAALLPKSAENCPGGLAAVVA